MALRAGRGSPASGGGRGGHYWHIDLGEQRVGRVFINFIDESPIGPHASIQIYVNKTHQGRGIGSIAYRLACVASDHSVVYAHIGKANVGSRKAAVAAGFEVFDHPDLRQLTMVWRRG